MRIHQPCRKTDALTLLELIVVIAAMLVLIGLLLPALGRARARSSRISCPNCLKQVGLAARIFANDNEEKFPWQVSTNAGGSQEYRNMQNSAFRHFQAMSNELSTPKVLLCPEDKERTTAINWLIGNQNVSYFVGLDASETNAKSLLSGDRYLTAVRIPTNGFLELTSNDNVRWTRKYHDDHGYLLLGDGSVGQVDSAGLQTAIRESGVATVRLAFP